jgi:hypothetical protein
MGDCHVEQFNSCMYVCMYVCMYIYIYMYVCMYVCMIVCICGYVCMYIKSCLYDDINGILHVPRKMLQTLR